MVKNGKPRDRGKEEKEGNRVEKKSRESKIYEKAIKNSPKDNRPRERLFKAGEHTLSNTELLAILLRKRKPVVYSELKYSLDTEVTPSEEREFLSRITSQMQRLGAEIAIPCFCEDKLLALINIGHKLNLNDIITNEDLELFSSLSNHTARALHGFMLHEEKIELIVASQNTLISAIEAKDRYTRGHTDRVAEYCTLIGKSLEKELRFYPNGLSDLKWATQLHDVGKIGISDTILLKKYEGIHFAPQIVDVMVNLYNTGNL